MSSKSLIRKMLVKLIISKFKSLYRNSYGVLFQINPKMNDTHSSTEEIVIEEWKINLAKSYFDKEKECGLMNKTINLTSNSNDDDAQEEDFCFITNDCAPSMLLKDDGLRRRNKKTIEVDTDFVNSIYDNEMVKISALNTTTSAVTYPVLKSPPSLKKLASSKMPSHDDSGYEGLDSSSIKNARILDQVTEEEEASRQSQSPEDRCYTEIFERHVRDSFHIVEYIIVLVMVCSIFTMVFMGDLEDGQSYGGKRAAIQYYYDKMNSNKYFF